MSPGSSAAVSAMIATIVLSATAGDISIAAAMRRIGDLEKIRAARGLGVVILTLLRSRLLLLGVSAMAISFFALLWALSHADVSLIAPAAGSLTFVTNAVAARWFLGENVGRRRWLAAILVCCGVALLNV